MQEGVYVSDPSGRLIDCNDAFVHMLGYSNRDELLVLNLDKEICVDANQRDTFRREIEAHNYVRNFEVTLRRRDGTLLLAAESSFATRDATGAIERYQGFVLDMTEKRRAEDEMQRRNRELNALNAMAVVAAQSFDLDEILNLTLRQVVTLFAAESGTVYLSDIDVPTFRRRAAWGPRSRDKGRPAEISFADGFGDLVMRSRAEVVTAEYLPHLPPNVAEFMRSDSDRTWIWVLFWGKGFSGRSDGFVQSSGIPVFLERREPAGRDQPATGDHHRKGAAVRRNLPRLRRPAQDAGATVAEREDVGRGTTHCRRSA